VLHSAISWPHFYSSY